jgi:hypothetical protein
LWSFKPASLKLGNSSDNLSAISGIKKLSITTLLNGPDSKKES